MSDEKLLDLVKSVDWEAVLNQCVNFYCPQDIYKIREIKERVNENAKELEETPRIISEI